MEGLTLSFRLGGIPVRIEPTFWVMTLLVGARGQLGPRAFLWVAVVLVSVLWHELGHALVARWLKHTVSISLHALGGTTSHQGPRLRAAGNVAVSLAGPGFGFVLGVGCCSSAALATSDSAQWVVAQLLWVNLGYGAMNLLPILPLDGGQAVRSVLEWLSPRRGAIATQVLSVLAAAALAALALMDRQRFGSFLWLLGWLAVMNVRAFKSQWDASRDAPLEAEFRTLGQETDLRRRIEGLQALVPRVRTDSLRARVLLFQSGTWLALQEYAKALEPLGAVPWTAGTAPPRNAAPRAYAGLGEHENALRAIERDDTPDGTALREQIRMEWLPLDAALAELRARGSAAAQDARLLLSSRLFHAGRFEDAQALSEEGFAQDGKPVWPYNVACCCARRGEVDAGVAWLRRALEAGWDNGNLLATDPDLDALRAHPDFPVRAA